MVGLSLGTEAVKEVLVLGLDMLFLARVFIGWILCSGGAGGAGAGEGVGDGICEEADGEEVWVWRKVGEVGGEEVDVVTESGGCGA